MRHNRSILRTVVLRFIGYYLGIEVTIAIAENLFRAVVRDADKVLIYDRLPELVAGIEPEQMILTVLWVLIQLAIYGVGIALFARGISRKVSSPAQHMTEGFREVAGGNLDVRLDFETETEFREMRDTFNVMAERHKASLEKNEMIEKERMQLFSHIAHDLKTPITTISGYSGALADRLVEDAEKQREYLLAIKAKADQMNELVGQLLSYSKLGSPQYQMNTASTDIAELLRASCASLFGEMEDRQTQLELQLPAAPVFLAVDSLHMSRALDNLLINAIRHNPARSLLLVSLTEEADRVVITVADNGPHIPKAINTILFEPFVLGDDSRHSGRGSGLGLPIVKKIIEQHNGEIVLAEAKPPYTKAFVLKLPRNQ